MTDIVRFGGAQIPYSSSIDANLITLKKAIDWAAENDVEYLVTPEAALSGYSDDFNDNPAKLADALAEIELYAIKKHVGLCLGTLWNEIEFNGNIKRNQIRYYKNDGKFLGITNKNITIEQDARMGIVNDHRILGMILPVGPTSEQVILAGGLICVDLFGTIDRDNVPSVLYSMGIKLMIHATNGMRGEWPTNPEETELADEVMDHWHDANFRRYSFLSKVPIITVDNCYMMDGKEYHGKTSSQSGVIINGRWATKVPRTGTQYFYYDFNLKDIVYTPPINTDTL